MCNQRLIEAAFPVTAVSRASQREKRDKGFHPNGIHLWPGRRPLAACRAGILATQWGVMAQDKVQIQASLERLQSAINGTPQPNLTSSQVSPRFLDPFGGGGSFCFEALKLGYSVVSNDLNPVAHLIQRATVEFPFRLATERAPLPQSKVPVSLSAHINYWGDRILAQSRAELPTVYGQDASDFFWWSWQIDCANCGLQFPLLKTSIFLNQLGRCMGLSLQHRPDSATCTLVIETNPACDEATFNTQGARCPRCRTLIARKAVQQIGQAGKLSHRMLVMLKKGESGWQPHVAQPQDQELAEDLRVGVEKCFRDIPLGLPEELITPDPDHIRVPLYGLTRFSDLFLTRQLLVIGTLVKETRRAIVELKSMDYPSQWQEAVSLALGLLLSRVVERNSQLSLWQPRKTCASSTFSRYTLSFSADFAEANTLGCHSGSYAVQLQKMSQTVGALCHALSKTSCTSQVECLNRDVALGVDGRYDLIATDPPYWDSLSYAALSDYFYVWIRRVLWGFFPQIDQVLQAPTTPKLTSEGGEMILERGRHGGNSARSQNALSRNFNKAFAVIANALSPGGRLLLVYAANHPRAWAMLAEAIQVNGLEVTACWPVVSEAAGRPRSRKSKNLSASHWLCLKHRNNQTHETLGRLLSELKSKLPRWRQRLTSWRTPVADRQWHLTACVLAMYSQWAKVIDEHGQPVNGLTLMEKVAPIVTDDARAGARGRQGAPS